MRRSSFLKVHVVFQSCSDLEFELIYKQRTQKVVDFFFETRMVIIKLAIVSDIQVYLPEILDRESISVHLLRCSFPALAQTMSIQSVHLIRT